jgi:hypothetical protein
VVEPATSEEGKLNLWDLDTGDFEGMEHKAAAEVDEHVARPSSRMSKTTLASKIRS